MVTITYILAAVVLLGLCIFIHELGHLLGGKMVGIKAKVFSIGYGKGILKKKFGDTTYQITLIPFGGYCQFYGEDPSEDRKGEDYEFLSASPLRRVIVVIMGPMFNLLFGIVLFFMMNLIGYSTETNQINIPEYFKSGEYISPAYTSGLRSGDKIIEINGNSVINFTDIQTNIVLSEGKPVAISVKRNNKIHKFNVNPEKYTQKGHYTIGVLPYSDKVLIMNISEGDIASKAGFEKLDVILSINGKPVSQQEEFTNLIRSNVEKELQIEIVRSGNEQKLTLIPRLKEILMISQFEDARFIGDKFNTYTEKIDLIQNAILKKQLKMNNQIVTSFSSFKKELKSNSGKVITIENSGGKYSGIMKYEKYGFIGVETSISPNMIYIQYGLVDSISKAIVEPFNFIIFNVKSWGMLASGELDLRKNLSGPIRIAKIAGDVAYYRGMSAFILLMAKISIILMIMNLLPIPVVDGSYILFFLFEAIRGKPISEKIMEKIQFVGIVMLIILGVFVVFNDLSSLPFFQKLLN